MKEGARHLLSLLLRPVAAMSSVNRDTFSDKQDEAISNLATTEAALALFASSMIILTYARFKHLRRIAFELIVYLSVADIGSNVTYLMGNPKPHTMACQAQGFLQQMFEMASVLWTLVIGYLLWQNVDRERKAFSGAHARKQIHALVWGTALLSALLPSTTRSYGSTGAWCWVRGDSTGTVWRFSIFYGPLWLCMSANGFFYYRVRRKLKILNSFAAGAQATKLKRLSSTLRYYPLILIFCWTIPTINRVYNSVTDNGSYWLTIMSRCTIGMTGILNATAYGNTPAVRASWQALWREMILGNWSVIIDGSDLNEGSKPGQLSAQDQVKSLDDEEFDDPDDEESFDAVDVAATKSTISRGESSDSLSEIPLEDEEDAL